VEERIRDHAAALIEATGMKVVDIPFDVPNITAEWMMGNVSTLIAELGDLWPACAPELTQSIEDGLRLSSAFYNLRTAGIAEHKRLLLNQAMADVFDQVDLVIAATNPGPAFAADAEMSSPMPPAVDKVLSSKPARLGVRGVLGAVRMAGAAAPNLPASLLGKVTSKVPDMLEMGGLTICSNIYGNPAVSIPAGLVNGLPVGMQVLARHHADALLFDVALAAERELPWPITAAAASNR
jgi:aspartyl-tRNA(Asn)/glutamyl-tRNA(Gln) amidotransferase subunit A